MDDSWKNLLSGEVGLPYFRKLYDFLREEWATHTVFPKSEDMMNVFNTPYDRVKVVILGQDPYHNAGQAHGLSFSVLPGVKPPPSLQNIFKELAEDLGVPKPNTGYLGPWADQGVFLLNATLTVRAHEAGSHQGQGWEIFTDGIIQLLSRREQPMVFVLWGRYARAKKDLIDPRHVVIESAHPSPMAAHQGFFGSKPFSKANAALIQMGQDPIDWNLP